MKILKDGEMICRDLARQLCDKKKNGFLHLTLEKLF